MKAFSSVKEYFVLQSNVVLSVSPGNIMSDFKPDLIDLVFKELNSKDRFFFLIGIFISVFTDVLSQQSQQEHLFFFFLSITL